MSLKEKGFRKYTKDGVIVWARLMSGDFEVNVDFGIVHGKAGDYLIVDAKKGNQFPCDQQTFEATYEEVKE